MSEPPSASKRTPTMNPDYEEAEAFEEAEERALEEAEARFRRSMEAMEESAEKYFKKS